MGNHPPDLPARKDYVSYLSMPNRHAAAYEAGTGVGVAVDALDYGFGSRLKLVHITPVPKPISVVIAALKGKLSPAAEKFWQCAKEAAAK